MVIGSWADAGEVGGNRSYGTYGAYRTYGRRYAEWAGCSGEFLAAVDGVEVEERAEGNDAGRVDLGVGDVVVALDVIEVHGVGDARLLIEVAEVAGEVRVVDDAAEVALEVAVIDGVEAHERAEEPPVGFDDARAEEKALRGEAGVEFIERGEEQVAGAFVFGL